MAESIDFRYDNKYIPSYVPDNLKWFERYGLETWYNKNKCDEFLSNTDLHFEQMKIVNFDLIRNGLKLESKKLKQYQTIDHEEMKKYPKDLQQQITSSIFHNIEQKDLYVNGQTINEHFRNKGRSAGRGKFLKTCKETFFAKYW